MKVREGTFFVS